MFKKLGVIGGAGPAASALFYQKLVEGSVGSGQGGMPEVVILNYPFTRALHREESQQQSEILVEELNDCFQQLALLHTEVASIVCNTLHGFLDYADTQEVRILSIPETVKGELRERGVTRPLILSTQTTQALGLYQSGDYLPVFPADEQTHVDAVIDRVLSGCISPDDSALLSAVIHRISEREAIDAVVLGCTELPVLHNRHSLNANELPIFDSITLGARCLLEAAEYRTVGV